MVKCPNLGFFTGIALRLVKSGPMVPLKGVCLKSFWGFFLEFLKVLSDSYPAFFLLIATTSNKKFLKVQKL